MTDPAPVSPSASLSRRAALQRLAAGLSAQWLSTLAANAHAQAGRGPIAIGLVVPFTGATGAYGADMAEAAKRTIARINKEGGGVLGGRPFDLFIEDSESSPTATVVAVQKLLNINKVSALCGFWGTPEALAAKPIALQNNMPLLVSSSGNAITEGDTRGLVWRFQAKSSDWGGVIGRAVLKQGHKNVAILALQNPFVLTMVKPFEDAIKAGGGTIVDTVLYNPDQPSYRAEVEKVFGRRPAPAAVFVPALLPDFSSIVREVFRGGFDSRIFTLSIAADSEGKFLSTVGAEIGEGVRHFQPSPDLKSAGYARFLAMMNAPADRLFLFAGNTHDQLCMLAMAMERAKSAAPLDYTKAFLPIANGPGQATDDVVEALALIRAGKSVNFAGAGSSVDFSDRGDQMNRAFGHYVVQKGRNVLVEIVN